MRRRIFSLASLLSLLLFVATVVLWTFSYWRAFELTRSFASYIYDQKATDDINDGTPIYHGTIITRVLNINRGSLRIARQRSVDDFDLDTENVKDYSEEYPAGTRYLLDVRGPVDSLHMPLVNAVDRVIVLDKLGFFVGHCSILGVSSFVNFKWSEIAIPMWVLALLNSILPAQRAWVYVSSLRRTQDRLCPKCGYNLTGNTSGICPECGTAVKSNDVPIKIG